MEAISMSISRGMDKEEMVYIFNIILLSHKKTCNNSVCTNMEGPRDCQTEYNKSEDKDRYHISHIWDLKNGTNELIYNTKQK